MVTYEARLRGYDVKTLPNIRGSALDRLSNNTNLAWIDPATGAHPNYIYDSNITTPRGMLRFLEDNIEKDKRYTMQFVWGGRGLSGHIVSAYVDGQGGLCLYDPQVGDKIPQKDILSFLGRIKYQATHYGVTYKIPPKLLRVDDKHFNLDMVDKIMRRTK